MAHESRNRGRRLLAGTVILGLSAFSFACAGTPTNAVTTVPMPPIEQLEGIVRSILPVSMGLPPPCNDAESSQQGVYMLRCGTGADTYSFLVNVAALAASPADQMTATAIQNNRLADCTALKLCSAN